MPSEQEEFEFRLRLEQEQAAQAAPKSTAQDLKAAHAKNVAAGEAAYKPSWFDLSPTEIGKELVRDVGSAIQVTPERLGKMASGIGSALKQTASEAINPANYGRIENPIAASRQPAFSMTNPAPPMIEGITEPLISPRTTGKALTEAAVDTALLGGAAKGIEYGAKTAAPTAARRIAQSILKPAEGDFKFSKDPVNAFLEEKFTGNLPKIRKDVVARKGELLNEVQGKLAQSTETTPRSQVLDILENEKARIAGEVGTTNDKALNRGIDIIKRKIENNYPEELSQPELHKLRREIDDSIPKFTSEAVEQGLNNVRYNLRSGLNDIMEANNPGIAKANKRVSELIDIDRMLGNRARQAANAPLPGLGRGTTLTDLALGIPRAALGSPAVLTRAANVLNTFAPKPGLAGAIGSIGAAPAVAPRKPGLAGALERTQPAPAFKGDIKPAVSQAATQAGPAATIVSPQPAGGLAELLSDRGGNFPTFANELGEPLSIEQLASPEFFEALAKKKHVPRSALESTPTMSPTRGGY